MEKSLIKNSQLHFLLFSCCVAVKGASRSAIVDLQREQMYFISNELFEVAQNFRVKPWQSILDEYDDDSVPALNGYIQFLEKNELGFWTESPGCFPEMDLGWVDASLITNCIIDCNKQSDHDWPSLFEQLEELGCRDLQIRCYDKVNPDWIHRIFNLLDNKRIRSVELILKYDKVFTKPLLRELTDLYFRIKTITLHAAPRNEVYRMYNNIQRCGMGNIIFVKQVIDSNSHCGAISPLYFSLSGVRSFTESVHHNSCLNRKIGIDADGSIKNCPSLPKSYGNTRDTRLEEVLGEDFKAVWNITKDQIETCKVCEFRYVCTDCRAFVSNASDPLSKPAKCGYDPYTMKWNGNV